MQEQRADALQLAVGKPASLLQNGSVRPITREPLNDTQIQGLLREIASGDAAGQLASAEPLSFAYRSPFGDIRVEVRSGPGAATVLRPSATAPTAPAPSGPAPSHPSAPSSSASATSTSSSPAPSSPAPSSPSSPSYPSALAEQRGAMESLFRQLVQSGASD